MFPTISSTNALTTFKNGRFCHGRWAQAADGTGYWSGEDKYTPRKGKVKPTDAEIQGYKALEARWMAAARLEPNNRGVKPLAAPPAKDAIPESCERGNGPAVVVWVSGAVVVARSSSSPSPPPPPRSPSPPAPPPPPPPPAAPRPPPKKRGRPAKKTVASASSGPKPAAAPAPKRRKTAVSKPVKAGIDRSHLSRKTKTKS